MKKNVISKNYLENIPVYSDKIEWSEDESRIVTLNIYNTGFFNRIAQFLFKKPKISYVHLDEFGSYVWHQINAKSDIIAIGEKVREHFGKKAEPLYERLAKYFQILESYGFISFK